MSEILYGKVFLSNSELLKSNDWLSIEFSNNVLDLYEFPIKYGNFGSKVTESRVAKYAYVPSGNSGVFPNLPLFSSKSPEFV